MITISRANIPDPRTMAAGIEQAPMTEKVMRRPTSKCCKKLGRERKTDLHRLSPELLKPIDIGHHVRNARCKDYFLAQSPATSFVERCEDAVVKLGDPVNSRLAKSDTSISIKDIGSSARSEVRRCLVIPGQHIMHVVCRRVSIFPRVKDDD